MYLNAFSHSSITILLSWQQEKHFVQAVALEALAEQPLVFKGGTCLWFFHGLPRFSEDLDFTASGALPEGFPGTVSRSLELFGLENSVKTFSDNDSALSFRLSVKGPLNTAPIDECGVYVEISKRGQVEDKTLSLGLGFPEYNLPVKRLAGMSLKEIAAEKVRALVSREKARDLFDLFFLIKWKGVPFDSVLAGKKLAFYGEKFSVKGFLGAAAKKEAYFEKELKNLVFDDLPEFSEVMSLVRGWVK